MIVLPWNGPETVACGKPTWVNFMQKYNLKYVHFDGCALGLKDKRGQFLRKPWCVATNDLRILQRFGQYIYPGNHEPMQGTNSLELSAILWLLRTQYDLNVGTRFRHSFTLQWKLKFESLYHKNFGRMPGKNNTPPAPNGLSVYSSHYTVTRSRVRCGSHIYQKCILI